VGIVSKQKKAKGVKLRKGYHSKLFLAARLFRYENRIVSKQKKAKGVKLRNGYHSKLFLAARLLSL
jgi:hypothetical protein